jgi:uncharacterized membrane protein
VLRCWSDSLPPAVTTPLIRRAEPPSLRSWLPRGAIVAGGALAGLGLIFWIAANWSGFGRFGRIALIEAAFLIACVCAWRFRNARSAAGIAALLAIGALFACLGQTYQTGADPWQLFALWAALGLPLCIGLRSPALWVPWTVVAMICIERLLFLHPDPFAPFALGAAAAFGIACALSPRWQRYTGSGLWPFRTALLQAIGLALVLGIAGLFSRHHTADYWLALVMLAGTAWLLYRPQSRDVAGLCAAALAIDVLLVAGGSRLLLDGASHEPVAELMLLALAAIGLLATTAWLLKDVRQ